MYHFHSFVHLSFSCIPSPNIFINSLIFIFIQFIHFFYFVHSLIYYFHSFIYHFHSFIHLSFSSSPYLPFSFLFKYIFSESESLIPGPRSGHSMESEDLLYNVNKTALVHAIALKSKAFCACLLGLLWKHGSCSVFLLFSVCFYYYYHFFFFLAFIDFIVLFKDFLYDFM